MAQVQPVLDTQPHQGQGRPLSLFQDDPLRRFLIRIRFEGEDHPRILKRVLVAVLASWPVLAALSFLDGVWIGPTPRESFWFDEAALVQFLVVVPIMLAAERSLDSQIARAGRHLEASGLVAPSRAGEYHELLQRLAAVRRNAWPDALILVAAYASTWTWLREELSNGVATWHARGVGSAERLTMAGWWEGLVAVPLLHVVLFRVIWKVALWCYALRGIAGLGLRLVPAHPDRAGGIGFIGDLQARFGVLIFAVGMLVAATVRHKIAVEQAGVWTYAMLGPLVAFVVLAPPVFLGPLLLFTATMSRAKAEALHRYSELIAKECRAVEAGWSSSPLTGSALPQFGHLGDAQGMYAAVESMRIVPFDLVSVFRLSFSAGVPMLAVLDKVVPLPAAVRHFLEPFV